MQSARLSQRQSHTHNRRRFLKSSAVVAGGLFIGNAAAQTGWAADFRSPLEQPGVGFIGCGIRFHSYHAREALAFGPAIAICDVDSSQRDRAIKVVTDLHQKAKRPLEIGSHEDYRSVLDNKKVDVVVVGTVDHWHTKVVIDALRAGKDVYCEKPVTLTICEGQQILKVLKETGRTLQVGTQQRTEFNGQFAKAVAMMHDGRIGDPRLTTIAIGGARESGPLPVCDPPAALNWDLWQGQCPVEPYRAAQTIVDSKGWGAGFPFSRTHRYYRWFYEYSGGKLTDWGAHHVDIAMWAHQKFGSKIGPIKIEPLEVEHPVEFVDGMPTQNDRFNCATKFKVKCTFADETVFMIRHSAVSEHKEEDKGFENGIMFEGTNGRFLVNRGKLVGRPVEELKDRPLPEPRMQELYAFDLDTQTGWGRRGFHMKDFMECCKTGRRPSSDMQSHHEMLNVCHAVNIAMRLGKSVVYDPATEDFGDDQVANSFVARKQRAGFETDVS